MSMLLVHELHEARDRILLLKQRLVEARTDEMQTYQKFIDEQIRFLDDTIDQACIPDRYRVAVVGRFKVGKSAFVNKLAGERLAGVDTNPETAAISVFRYDEQPRAEVELVSSQEWERLKEEHNENPKNPEVKRYDRFMNFNDRPLRRDKDGKELPRTPIDLDYLSKCWLKPGGMVHRIESPTWASREEKKKFLAKIRHFTTSQEPLHYLVNKITIYAPIPILRDQIELIDTPGLDDTERFRVLLTEELVKDVDAILFLTVSGASYSQSDKEFIVRQLRRRQIKHLQLIVTKSDETYENAVRDARENDENPPPYNTFMKKEINRVRLESQETLNELLQSNELTDEEGYYFIEQLSEVPIHLISTKYHDDGDTARGGIEAVRDSIYHILSTSKRFEQAKSILTDRLEISLKKLQNSYRERLGTIEQDFDPQKVRNEIQSIRKILGDNLNFFAEKSEGLIDLLKHKQNAFKNTLPLHLDVISYLANEVLGDLEKDDLLKHWKTRRVGRWGYLLDLQAKVADRIFPKVEARLNELRSQMSDFMSNVSILVQELQSNMSGLEEEHRLSNLEPIALSNAQEPLFNQLESVFDNLTISERDSIVARLDEFVTEEVTKRLDDARSRVSNVLGRGTTSRQGEEVKSFYDELRCELRDALRTHLKTRIDEYMQAIISHAESIAPQIRQASEGLIQQRLDAIKSTLSIATLEEKNRVTSYLTHMTKMLDKFPAGTPDIYGQLPPPDAHANADIVDNPSEVHYEIPENATGFTYERIFKPFMNDAAEIVIEDPYIKSAHQVDNLSRFCALAVRIGFVKKITLKTGTDYGDQLKDIDSRLETLRRDLTSRCVEFNWERIQDLHDREFSFNNGWTVKIGRGLDIYQKPESWVSIEAADFSLRRCRRTKVDAFKNLSS